MEKRRLFCPFVVVAAVRENSAPGVELPSPRWPPLLMRKSVADEEPMANEGPISPSAFIDSAAHGVVVLIPTAPPPVAKYAEFDEVRTEVEAYAT